MTLTIHHGDAVDVLPTLAPGSVQCIVTSPPYFGLRNYNIAPTEWPAVTFTPMPGLPPITIPAQTVCLGLEADPLAYTAHLLHVFRLARPALRDDGVAWLNLGDCYAQDSKWGGRSGGKNYTSNAGGISRERKRTGLKDKDLMLIPARVAMALQADGWYVRSQVIWHKPNCLSGGTSVYARTQKGDMPAMIKDLVRLRPETVQLWNGERWTQVLKWTENPRPERPLELTLRNGQRIGCTPDHLWPTQRGNVRADQLVVGDVIQTCTLPEPDAPRDPRLLPASVGYLVGMYIAEGSMSGDCIQISGHVKETERFELLCNLAEQYGGTCRMHKTGGNTASINIHSPMLRAILEMYVSGHGSAGKHLTVACWQRDNRFLNMVLRGYLAGDGHYDTKNNRYRLGFTRNYSLESDLRTLCARLGYSLRLVLATGKIDERVYPTFRGEMRERQRADDGEIVKIAGSKARKFWDITVADEPHLFSLASGVLTHNCMPESVTDRPTNDYEPVYLLAKSARYYFDAAAIAEPQIKGAAGSRFDAGKTGTNGMGRVSTAPRVERETRNRRAVWRISTEALRDEHYAPMPSALVEPCILAATLPIGADDPDDLIATPIGDGERMPDPSIHTGRAGFNRARRDTEGTRPMSRREQAAYAEQLRASPYRNAMEVEAGSAFAHYIRTDRSGARPVPPAMLDAWVNRGWVEPVTIAPQKADISRSTVLDPFFGSGTVGRVALQYGRACIGIDKNDSYIAMSERRTDGVQIHMEALL